MSEPFDIRRIEVADAQTVRVMGSMSAGERLRMVDELVRFARQVAAAGIRASHPDWSEPQVVRELARRASRGPR